MATLITECRNCGKDVEVCSLDLSKPGMDEVVGNVLKNKALCGVCNAEVSDKIVIADPMCPPGKAFIFPDALISDLTMEKLQKTTAFIKLVEQMTKVINSPAYIIDYDNIDFTKEGTVKFLECKPGGMLHVKKIDEIKIWRKE